MVQNFPDIPSSKAVRDSRQDILDRDEAIRSAFSGTTYPSTNLIIGMLCFRTDLGQLFQLTATSPITWTRIPLGIPVPLNQGGTGATDAATARTNLGLAALSVKNTVGSNDIDNLAIQTAKIADGSITTAKITDANITTAKLVDLNVTTVKIADSAITSAKIADGTISTSDLASQTITDIRSGIDLSARVAKTGDTMTGTLTAPGLVSTGSVKSGATGDNARATGYQISDGSDIGELNRSAQYYDDRANNCRGSFATNNCNGDLKWNPPNTSWWTWTGVTGVSRGNPSGFDFAGGTTSANNPFSYAYVYDAYYVYADEIGGTEYHRNYNNCNCGTFNCYTNCNCNCNCACSTDSGGSSCFLEGSIISMADGSVKEIQNVLVGDYVVGAFGEHNEIIAKDNVTLGDRWMYKINDEHDTSDDHPHVSPDRQFYSADVAAIYKEWGQYFKCEFADGSHEMWQNIGLTKTRVQPLKAGLVLLKADGPRLVETIEPYRLPPQTRLYNFVVGGSHTYFVNGYCVTGWPREDDFDYQTWQPTGKILTIKDYRDPHGKKVRA